MSAMVLLPASLSFISNWTYGTVLTTVSSINPEFTFWISEPMLTLPLCTSSFTTPCQSYPPTPVTNILMSSPFSAIRTDDLMSALNKLVHSVITELTRYTCYNHFQRSFSVRGSFCLLPPISSSYKSQRSKTSRPHSSLFPSIPHFRATNRLSIRSLPQTDSLDTSHDRPLTWMDQFRGVDHGRDGLLHVWSRPRWFHRP